jgi:hypothetical protein
VHLVVHLANRKGRDMIRLIKHFFHPWRLAAVSVTLVLSVLAGDNSADARTFDDLICDHVCPPIDLGLTAAEKFIQLKWAHWKHRTQVMSASPLVGRGVSCGRLPDAESTARCCLDESAHLLIEFEGRNPYAFPETAWRAICKAE